MYTRNCEIIDPADFPNAMQRWCLCVQYNGAAFRGFQAQRSAVTTVQETLQAALSSVADEPISCVCAGRTDAGVHATYQPIHFDTLAQRPAKAWTLGVNGRLPSGVSVQWAEPVAPNFHARFSARARTYRYLIHASSLRSALMSEQVTWFRRPLNAGAMIAAAATLVGEHDFSAFRAAQCQARSPVRDVRSLRFARHGELLVMEITANAFLHHMVRNIAGALLAVGAGDKPIEWIAELLASKDRRQGAVTAAAAGLYLVDVVYPDFSLPVSGRGPFFLPSELHWLSQESGSLGK